MVRVFYLVGRTLIQRWDCRKLLRGIMFGSKPLCHTTRLENAGEQIMFGSTTIVLHWPNIIRVLGQEKVLTKKVVKKNKKSLKNIWWNKKKVIYLI